MRLLIVLSLALSAQAGTVKGVVVEYSSGRPLARTIVRLDGVPGTGLKPITLRTDRNGNCTFTSVPPGLYFVTAVREGYLPVAYGQRLPTGRGLPLSVTAESMSLVELRMRHKGALTGRVLDENGVGVMGVPIVAYRASLPLRSAAKGISDDRGVYRIPGLDPGKYWVRSAAHLLEDGSGWQPTFGPQSREPRDAQVSRVTADTDVATSDIYPGPAPLYTVAGSITCERPGRVTVMLSSGTGQSRADTECTAISPGSYQFRGLAAGEYEIQAMAEAQQASAFLEFTLGHDLTQNLILMRWPDLDVEVWRAGAGAAANIPVTLVAVPQSLSEVGTPMELREKRVRIGPGYWEFSAQVPDGYYVESITNAFRTRQNRPNAWRSPNAFEVFVHPQFNRIRLTLSDQPGKVSGLVNAEGKGVAGAPVYLWPVAEAAKRSLGRVLETIADKDGAFRFDNLPPGDYRALASFDVNEIDDEIAELSRAPVIQCQARQTAVTDLALWTAPY